MEKKKHKPKETRNKLRDPGSQLEEVARPTADLSFGPKKKKKTPKEPKAKVTTVLEGNGRVNASALQGLLGEE